MSERSEASTDNRRQDGGDEEKLERIATLARTGGWSVAVAESLTAGQVSARLGAGDKASEWFRGAVVAYAKGVKFDVLGVSEGPVVTALCAREMAQGVRHLLGADIGVAVTGVGGPGPEEGKPPGTVHLALARGSHVRSDEVHVEGAPEEVLATVTSLVLAELARELEQERQ